MDLEVQGGPSEVDDILSDRAVDEGEQSGIVNGRAVLFGRVADEQAVHNGEIAGVLDGAATVAGVSIVAGENAVGDESIGSGTDRAAAVANAELRFVVEERAVAQVQRAECDDCAARAIATQIVDKQTICYVQ